MWSITHELNSFGRMHFPFYSYRFLGIHEKSIRFVHWRANERAWSVEGRGNWWLYQLTVLNLYCSAIGINPRPENCDNLSIRYNTTTICGLYIKTLWRNGLYENRQIKRTDDLCNQQQSTDNLNSLKNKYSRDTKAFHSKRVIKQMFLLISIQPSFARCSRIKMGINCEDLRKTIVGNGLREKKPDANAIHIN